MSLSMAFAVAGFESEFAPSTWTIENWKGVGFAAVAFFVLLYVIIRAAKPAARGAAERDEPTMSKEPEDEF